MTASEPVAPSGAPESAPFVRLYPDVLSQELREALLEHRVRAPPLRRTVGDGGFDEWLLPEGDLAMRLRALQFELLKRYARDCRIAEGQWPTSSPLEPLRLKRYAPGQRFPPHVDVVDHATARRFLAFLWYVLSPAEGGETAFLPDGPVIQPSDGACLVFPPFWTHRHEGRRAAAEKVILSSYLHYA